MPGGMAFEYKCPKGHLTERIFPPRTPYDKYASILCPKCLDKGTPVEAYLVWASPERREKKTDA